MNEKGNGKKMDVDLYIVGKLVVPCVGIFGLSTRKKDIYRIWLMNVEVVKYSGVNFLFVVQSSAVCSSLIFHNVFLKIACHKSPVSGLITRCFQRSLFESHIRHLLLVYMEDVAHSKS